MLSLGGLGMSTLASWPRWVPGEKYRFFHRCQGRSTPMGFPYNRGWENQPKSVGVYIPIIRIPIKGGRSPIPKKTRLLTMSHRIFGRIFWGNWGYKPTQPQGGPKNHLTSRSLTASSPLKN